MAKRLKRDYPYRVLASAVQGAQSPGAAKRYGKDGSLGAPCMPLVRSLEQYSSDTGGELMFLATQGSYAGEIDLDPFFHDREDVYMNSKRYNKLKADRRSEFPQIRKNGGTSSHFWEISNHKYATFTDLTLNENLSIFLRPNPSQNRDPLAAAMDLPRYFGKSVVFPATKQRLAPAPKNLGEKTPHLVLTTGCCNLPNYNGTNDRGDRAFRDHVLGCAVIDVVDDNIYLPRLAKANAKGTLFDLGIKYVSGKDPKKAEAIALVAGDLHIPFHHQKSLDSTIEMANLLEVREVIIGDIIDFLTIAHWNWDDALHAMALAKIGLTRLEDEAKIGYDVTKYIAERIAPAKLLITHGNHDDFVIKYLKNGRHFRGGDALLNGRFCNGVLNRMGYGGLSSTSVDEFLSKREGLVRTLTTPNAVKACLEEIGTLPENVDFLNLGDDHRHWGIQTGAHGHKGPRGTRGNLKNHISGFGKATIGHTHQLEEKDGSISVSTLCHPLPYEEGQPSVLVRGNAAIYEGGLQQAIPMIGDDAVWATEDHKKMLRDLKKK